jgi:hypothetical protein
MPHACPVVSDLDIEKFSRLPEGATVTVQCRVCKRKFGSKMEIVSTDKILTPDPAIGQTVVVAD